MGEAFAVASTSRVLRLGPSGSGGLEVRCGGCRRFVPRPVVEQLTPGEMGRAVAAVARAGRSPAVWITDTRTVAAGGVAIGPREEGR